MKRIYIVAIVFLLASINLIANDCDIRKIIGVDLGDKYEEVEIWTADNNLNALKDKNFIYITSLPANEYHFQSILIDFDKAQKVKSMSLIVDSNFVSHPRTLAKLLDTLKAECNDYKDYGNANILVLNFDNCVMKIRTKLTSAYPSFILLIELPK